MPNGVRRGGWCCAALAILWTSAAPSGAQEREGSDGVVLTWRAPDECPAEDYVVDRVRRILGSERRDRSPLRAHAKVVHVSPEIWRVDLTTAGPEGEGERSVTAESCLALADATALILALAVDPSRVASHAASSRAPGVTRSPAPAPAAAPAPAPAHPPRRAPAPAPASRERPPWAYALSLSAFGDLGNLAVLTPGLSYALTVAPRPLQPVRFEIGAGLSAREPNGSGAEVVSLALRVATFSGCAASRGRFEAGGCLDADVAWVLVRGVGQLGSLEGQAVWPILRLRATAAFEIFDGIALRADLGPGIGLGAPSVIRVSPRADIFIRPTPAISVRGALGVSFRF